MSEKTETANEGISRRELLIGAGAMAALSSGITQAAEHMHGDHAGHRHEDHAPKHEDLLGARHMPEYARLSVLNVRRSAENMMTNMRNARHVQRPAQGL